MNPISLSTPLGEMLAVFAPEGLCLLEFADQVQLENELRIVSPMCRHFVPSDNVVKTLRDELAAYFSGSLKVFSVPLYPIGTPFQKNVWHTLQQISYGTTWSYKQQAVRVGNINAVRAVGAANGKNKISILIPCHRVIGNDGKLTGYAGGIARKQALLELEQKHTVFEIV